MPHLVHDASPSRVPFTALGLAPTASLLLAGSRRVTGGSPLLWAQRTPSGLRRCCQRLPCSDVFLVGTRRASPVSYPTLSDVLPSLPRQGRRRLIQNACRRFCLRL